MARSDFLFSTPMPARITIVEDEPAVRDVLSKMLQHLGYQTLGADACARPDAAGECRLECCSQGERPDLLILEIALARACSGVHAALKALCRWPGVKILLVTGCCRQDWPAGALATLELLPRESFSFLAKPFAVAQLRRAVENLLRTNPYPAPATTWPASGASAGW